jgi:hypothetical protein
MKKKPLTGNPKKKTPTPSKKPASMANRSANGEHVLTTRGNHRRTSPARAADFSGGAMSAKSCAEQREFLLSTLAVSGRSSYWFRNNGCYQVPTRVFELRKLGHDIRTSLVTIVDADGWSHPRCAFYEIGVQLQIGLDFGPAANDPALSKKGSKK